MSARRPPAAAVDVRIEELRLEGFEPRHRARIARALERELARLLQARVEQGQLEPLQDAGRVDGGSFSFRADDPPHRIGAAIARATFRGLTGAPPVRDRNRG